MKYLLVLAFLATTATSAATAHAEACGFVSGRSLCRGDRNCDCNVTIDELTYLVNASQYGGDFCSNDNPVCDSPNGLNVSHGDADCNWQITVAELQQAVNNSLNGCLSPCYSGLNYPASISGILCTATVFRNNHCGGIHCSHAQCGACP